ncbi:MAG: imidazole glycerol phosphate synthase, glutamine amidotransferase subunit [Clostridiales bacterium GWF2_38_85]|nr:MAG: imidazole glycerol phosphate synthase, glutamine amidotransferase subunit [Clostridiales bacterium GWF2_38_85]HBL84260.1 imidazole glycerol phosphate synthase subunit HisH [Clostridiales bacterium]
MISVIDYGLGNLHSVKNALDFLGVENNVISTAKELYAADALILPGVGAFPDAISALKTRKLFFELKAAAKEIPMLGICLGMQLLFEESDEFGLTEGLGLISGRVTKIHADGLKIPHMGWNELNICKKDPIIDGVDGGYVYFVHSYKAKCEERNIIADTAYGERIPTLVKADNIIVYGAQFHPEKSDSVGLKILNNFVKIINMRQYK